ncbi:MAG: hypothetical protein JRI68_27010 [Deltaproteobacteria bacterium]|nr:hypothetical protein [Deltaproteobacteria bacterium]
MRLSRLSLLSWGTALLTTGTPACFDWGAYEPGPVTTSTSGAGGAGGEGLNGGGGVGGSDGGSGGGLPDCDGDEFQCLSDGTAQECVGAAWQSLGPCPLGCDEGARECRVPSNVAPAKVGEGTGEVVVPDDGDDRTFNTDTGEITAGTQVIRPAGEGLDGTSGIAFSSQAQGTGQPGLGVFSMSSLDVQAGAVLRGEGESALVVLVDGNVQIDGLVTIAATDVAGGPGGYAGGAADNPGGGPCGGLAGAGSYPGDNCTSGSGGAGYAAPGGPGGTATCSSPDNHAAGAGGPGTCGNEALVPLLGGNGGAGGTVAGANSASVAGPGGSGGGALQISAAGTITVGATGQIDAGGAGGGEAMEAGGAGGGSGGAVLLEAPTVTVSVGAVLAANGGGGGGGDCN